MSFGWLFFTCLAFGLELLVIFYLARGPRKRFPFVFVFCAVLILGGSADTFSTLIGVPTHVYARIYWAGDMIEHGATSPRTLPVICLSLEPLSVRRRAVGFLGLAVLCFALFSAYIFHDPNINRWMTSVSRNLSF